MAIKLFALAVVAVILSAVLKKYCPEFVPLFNIALAVTALFIVSKENILTGNALMKIFSADTVGNEVFTTILKGAAVTVITKLSADVCRDGNNGLMADIVELGGRIMLIALAVPFIEKLAETALSFAR